MPFVTIFPKCGISDNPTCLQREVKGSVNIEVVVDVYKQIRLIMSGTQIYSAKI